MSKDTKIWLCISAAMILLIILYMVLAHRYACYGATCETPGY